MDRSRACPCKGGGRGAKESTGEAIGLVMAEFTVTEDQAFVHLRRVSSVTNIKLRDVAANIVEKAKERASGRAVQQTLVRPTGNGRVNPPSGPRSAF